MSELSNRQKRYLLLQKTPSPDRQFIKTPDPDPFSGTLGDHFPPGNDRLFRFQQSCQDCPLLLEHGP